MKLAEALIARSALRGKLNDIQNRAIQSGKTSEGEKPLEDSLSLVSEHEKLIYELENLVLKINHVNQSSKLNNGISLFDALVKRDHLDIHINMLKTLINKTTEPMNRYSRSELKQEIHVDLNILRKKLEEITSERRNLEIEIQKINWTIDLE